MQIGGAVVRLPVPCVIDLVDRGDPAPDRAPAPLLEDPWRAPDVTRSAVRAKIASPLR